MRVENAGGEIGMPFGLGTLNPGPNDVDPAAWDKAKAHPFVAALMASGRLTPRAEAEPAAAEEPTPTPAAATEEPKRRKKAR